MINGAECEPYLTNDHRLMVERPAAVIRGAEIVRRKLGARRATIGVEDNKPDAIATLQTELGDEPVDIVGLPMKYPQGAEKMLIKAIYGIEVPAGQLRAGLRHRGQQRGHRWSPSQTGSTAACR